ncbi:MAG: hypothetical protein IJL64_03475 [Bacteroidales bacterium]|nr:hypothetical protein [Bacteroidales bacterium]
MSHKKNTNVSRWLPLLCGLSLLLCLPLRLDAVSGPYYVELTLMPVVGDAQTQPAEGVLQMVTAQADSFLIQYATATVAWPVSESQVFFFKMARRGRMQVRWISASDTLYSRPFRLSPIRTDMLVRAQGGRLKVHHIWYFPPGHSGRVGMVLLFVLVALPVKLLIALLVLTARRQPLRILWPAAGWFALTIFLCGYFPMSLLCLFMLPVVLETAGLRLCCKPWLGWKETLWFVLLTNVCTFGLVHLLYRSIFFM